MKPFLTLLFFSFLLLTKAQNATEIVKKMDEHMRGKSSNAELLIRIVRPSWTREMTVRTWMKGAHFAMILVLSPAKEKGIVFLKRKKEVWNWIPALERNIKLPPSMMTNSWMGTDFTNDDLVKEASAVEDYSHTILKDTVVAQNDCYLIEFLPKPNTAIVWGKLQVAIDKKYFIERYTAFYDEAGNLVNIMLADELKTMDGRLIPTHMQMIPIEKKGQKTELYYKSIFFNKTIEDDFFTTEKMKQIY